MSDNPWDELAEVLEVSLGSKEDLSFIHAAIEAQAVLLGWLNPLNPQLETALRNLARQCPMARYEPNRNTFWGLLHLLEWEQLQRLEERLRIKAMETRTDRVKANMAAAGEARKPA